MKVRSTGQPVGEVGGEAEHTTGPNTSTLLPNLIARLEQAGEGSRELDAPKVRRGYRYRLYPTPEQATTLAQWCGTVRAVYNAALAQRRDHWRNYQRTHGRGITFASQSAEIKNLRAEFDWIAAVPFDALTQSLRDLDRAFADFYSGKRGFPSYRKRGVNDALRVHGRDVPVAKLNAKWATVRVPKLGPVRYRAHRPLRGEVRSITLSFRGGAWWVALATEAPGHAATPLSAGVGIDRGVTQTLTLSTGEVIQAPDTSRLETLRRRAQRALARRKKGSARYAAAKARIARLASRQATARADWCHRASRQIADRFGIVAIENLHVAAMTASARGTADEPGRNVRQKAGLNRAILSQSWGRFSEFLDYKLAERGGVLMTIPPQYTSQTCSACGVIDATSRKNQAEFQCVACNHAENADVNAAKNIWLRSTELLDVEAGVARPSKRQLQEHRHA